MNNNYFSVELDNSLSLSITDKRFGRVYLCPKPFMFNYGNCYDYNLAECCEYQISRSDKSISVKFYNMTFFARFRGNNYCKPEPGPELQFEFSIILDKDHLVFRTEEIQGMGEEECSINYPHGLLHFDSSKKSELLLPCGYGSLIKFPNKEYFKFEYETSNHYNCIPLVAHFHKQGGLCVYHKTPLDLHNSISINCRQSGNAEVDFSFIFEKQNANYARELHVYGIAPQENYVDVAKLYRGIVKKEGRFVSLKEKIRENPEVEKLVGSVIWKHPVFSAERPCGIEKDYSYFMMHPDQNQNEGHPANWTAKEIFDTAKARAFDRVCVYNTGWNRDGFDKGYPVRLPPASERGTKEDFSKAAEYARSLSDDYIYSVHDNYIDVYESSEQFDKEELLSDSNGIAKKGGIWRGGRANMLCGHKQMKYAKRDIPEIIKMLGKGSIYIDVIGHYPFQSCHHHNHSMSKRDDMKLRREIMKYAKKQAGSLALEGAPFDCFTDIADVGAYCSIFINQINQTCKQIPQPVPFWQLVYHDSILNYTCESAFGVHGSEYLLYLALYAMLPTQLDDASKRLSFGLRNAYTAEMLSHEFIEPSSISFNDNGSFHTSGVARTVFSDGTEVVANFNQTEYNYREQIIPVRDFIIINAKG